VSRVVVVFTGGTISMQPDASAGGAVPTLDGQQILGRTPGLDAIAEVVPVDWGMVPASHLQFGQLLDIARLVERLLARDDIDGAVVVQGTDSIEETAFAFDLLIRSPKPLVVTGAMRNAAETDYDGPRNLTDAVRCAAAAELREMGTLVVLNGLIIGADQAVKTHTTALDTFQSRDGQPVGEVSDSVVRVIKPRVDRRTLPRVPGSAPADVHLLTVTVGMDGGLLRLLRPTKPAGVVIAATGAGNTSADLLAAATELMGDGTVVCLTTRCASGSVVPAYGFPGGGAQWQRTGALLVGLDGPKCRVGLALGLGAGLGDTELRRLLRA
jgi:L-asparaginase